jgi:hypothetical protein
MRIVQLMTDRSRHVNPSKVYWFSFSAFLISVIGLYFRCLSFRVVLVNTARPDGAINTNQYTVRPDEAFRFAVGSFIENV